MTAEVAQREVGLTIQSAPVNFQPSAPPNGPMVGEATIPIALLPPGDYVIRVVISVMGRKAGQVVRPFRIVKSPGP